MNKKKVVKLTLVLGLFLLSLGGWILHYRIHPPSKLEENYIPFIAGIVSVFCLPLLFWFKRTLNLAYILNGLIVIIGTIAMAQFSIVHFRGPLTPGTLVMNTLFADIAVLWAKFAFGKALFNLETLKSDTDTIPKGRFFRYPNMGWWWVHLVGLSTIYALGNILWK